jgi:hypothetical protein
MFAFYFYKYYVGVIKPIFEETTDMNSKAELEMEVKESFNRMNDLAAQCQLGNEGDNIRAMLEYTEMMFAKNEHLHQEGHFSKKIAEVSAFLFRTISPFTDCMRWSTISTDSTRARAKGEFTQRRSSSTS